MKAKNLRREATRFFAALRMTKEFVSQLLKGLDMIYVIGGAPRVGKDILAQRLCATLKVGWVSTDLLIDLLRVNNVVGVKASWDAAPEAKTANAVWFFSIGGGRDTSAPTDYQIHLLISMIGNRTSLCNEACVLSLSILET